MALNIQHGLREFGMPRFQEMIREAETAGELRDVKSEDVPHIVKDVVEGNWKRLRDAEKITGEWILFAKHDGKNYYLALATHDMTTHQHIRELIDTICCPEFPFIVDILNA